MENYPAFQYILILLNISHLYGMINRQLLTYLFYLKIVNLK